MADYIFHSLLPDYIHEVNGSFETYRLTEFRSC